MLGQRLTNLENDVRLLVESLIEYPAEPPRRLKTGICDKDVRRILAREEDAMAVRMRVCPPIAQDQTAWSLLLAAHRARVEGRSLSVTVLCSFAPSPLSTALRWLTELEKHGLLVSRPDDTDGRLRWVALSGKGSLVLTRYASEMAAGGKAAHHQ